MSKKIEKLLARLESLVAHMHKHHRDLTIQRRVDLYYYLQMETELRVLNEKFAEVSGRLKEIEHNLEEKYRQTFFTWQKDVRWLNAYIASREGEEKKVSVL